MKKLICFAIMLLFAAGISMEVQASPFPPMPDNEAILDTQRVISADTIHMLESHNEQLWNLTGGEVMFFITDFVPMGWTLADYTASLFNAWEVGSLENNNGILMILELGTGDYHIVVGGGLAHYMTASYLHSIAGAYFEDHFFAGDYDLAVRSIFEVLAAGILDMFPPEGLHVNETEAAANNTPAQNMPVTEAPPAAGAQQGAPPVSFPQVTGGGNNTNIVIIIVVILIILMLIPRRRRFGGGMMGRGMMGPRRGFGGGMMGGMLGGYMLGRARHRQPGQRQAPPPQNPPAGGGFTRGGNTRGGGYGGTSRGSAPRPTGGGRPGGGGLGGLGGGLGGGRSGGFTRGGSSFGGGYGGRRR